MITVDAVLERGVFLDGAVQPVEGDTLTITNPGTGELVGRVTAASATDADAAVRSAHAALRDWSRLGYAERGRILHACAEAVEGSVEELVPILVAEQG
jgi:acyl-CoA reductase-like NAD-dependent aldehyde dehydrogenase